MMKRIDQMGLVSHIMRYISKMSDFECPYCGAEQHDDGESNETDVVYVQECRSCGKTFVFTVDYIKTYEAEQAPCQNGQEHNLEPIVSTYHPPGFIRHRCTWCDEEFRIPVEEAAKGEK